MGLQRKLPLSFHGPSHRSDRLTNMAWTRVAGVSSRTLAGDRFRKGFRLRWGITSCAPGGYEA